MAALVQQTQQQQQQHLLDMQQQHEAAIHLPTVLGLKIRNPQKLQQHHQQQQHQQHKSSNTNPNSLLKQQLRAGPKEIQDTCGAAAMNIGNKMKTAKNSALEQQNNADSNNCTALQSLANVAVAERQAPPPAAQQLSAIQPPSANNLHHQFLLHMAANPMIKSSNDFFQHQQQLQQQQQQQLLECESNLTPPHLDIILDQNDKSEPELTLADETAGLDYKLEENESATNEGGANNDGSANGTERNLNANSAENETKPKLTTKKQQRNSASSTNSGNTTTRPIQRRRIRRKAQSTSDDQAEHLTEMSVRGLDLFRYASISEGVYQCIECAKESVQKTFKNKYSFQRHAFLYHEGKHRKVFPCPVCGKEFSRPDKMKNHLKLTHESFVAKDLNNFNPLNYLINAAAAGEIKSSIFTQQQQHPLPLQQQQQQQPTGMLDEPKPTTIMGFNLTPSIHLRALTTTTSRPSSPTTKTTMTTAISTAITTTTTPADALLQLQNDIAIKNEIVISPSPSPPPLPSSFLHSPTTKKAALLLPTATTITASSSPSATAPPTQRLEEVK